MTVSTKGLNMIKAEEQCRLKAYLDSAGVPTIGWGNTMYKTGKKVKLGDKITQAEADELLAWEVAMKAVAVYAKVKPFDLNQNQFDALIDFTYNCGVTAFSNSTILKLIKKNKDDPAIGEAFMRWNEITDPLTHKKIVSQDLTARRKREVELYFS